MLSDTLSALLGRPLTEETVHSRTICECCLKLCTEFDALSHRMDAIKMQFIQSYNDTIKNNYCLDMVEHDADDSNAALLHQHDALDVMDAPTGSEHVQPDEDASQLAVQVGKIQAIDLQTVFDNDMEEIVIQGKKVVLLKASGRNNLDSTSSTAVPFQDLSFHMDNESDADGGFLVEFSEGRLMSASAKGFSSNKQDLFDELQPAVDISPENQMEAFEDEFVDAMSQTSEAQQYLEHIKHDELSLVKTEDVLDYDGLQLGVVENGSQNMLSLDPDESMVFEEVTMKPIFVRDGDCFKCQLCDEHDESTVELFDNRSIVAHMKTKHNERVFVCDLCGADYRKKMELAEHMEEHVKGNININIECGVCQEVFSNLRLFRSHSKQHASSANDGGREGIAPPPPSIPKSWTCKFCNKKYSSRNQMEEHKNMHTGDRPYKCGDCPKDFASKYTLNAHTKIHSERKRPYGCPTCPKTFYSNQNLAQHERTHTGVKEHQCDVCDKAFGTAHNLDVHKIVHTGYKPFICRTCGKAFARRAEIKDHERTHTGERPYACDECGASFAQRSNLTSHRRATHLNDKRYKCEQCGKTFKRRRLLDYHCKASHTGERPYTCQVCRSTFVYPEHYKKHLRIHTGLKPFECEVCGKAFNSRDNRNAHRFVHSDKKPYECLFCGAGFMRKPQLLAHMKIFNHENKRIVLNQPRIMIVEEDEGGSEKTVIDSNVVYIEDCVDDIEDEEEYRSELNDQVSASPNRTRSKYALLPKKNSL